MSSKASKLGKGTSFAQTQPVSARRQAITAATKAPTDGTPPPLKLPVELISLNPANPRSQLGDLTQLAGSLRDHGQKQAISIMSRFAFLEANPDKEGELEDGTKYVAIDGNSRLAAAREVGLTEIKVTLDEELGSNPDEVLESALVANIHRRDLDPLDEARALQQLLEVHKNQEALATRLHRSQGWVSQRLALLGLTPELKEKLLSGEEPAELLRRVGNKRPEEQEQHLQRLKEQKQRKAAPATSTLESEGSAPAEIAAIGGVADLVPKEEAATAGQTSSPPTSPAERAPATEGAPAQSAEYYGVMSEEKTDTETRTLTDPTAATPSPASTVLPVQRPELSAKPPIRMPWDNGARAMDIAFDRLTKHHEWHSALARYIELVGGPKGFVDDLVASSTPEFRAEIVEILTASD